jgi:hypothetical protein
VETSTACTAASSAKAAAWPVNRSIFASGIVISRSSVPVVRSLSIVIEVTRNIVISGKTPSSGPPIRSNTGKPW